MKPWKLLLVLAGLTLAATSALAQVGTLSPVLYRGLLYNPIGSAQVAPRKISFG